MGAEQSQFVTNELSLQSQMEIRLDHQPIEKMVKIMENNSKFIRTSIIILIIIMIILVICLFLLTRKE